MSESVYSVFSKSSDSPRRPKGRATLAKRLKDMMRIGKLFSEILAESGLELDAYMTTINNDGLVRVDDALTAIASKTVFKQGKRAQSVDLPDTLFFAPITRKAAESVTKEGKSRTQISSGNAQIAHAEHGEAVNYSPTMPSHKIFLDTGNAYAKAYRPRFEDEEQTKEIDSAGFAHHFTTDKYKPFVALQHAVFAHIARFKKPFTLADVLGTCLAKAGMADAQGRANVNNADDCVCDTLQDLRKFGFLLGNNAAKKYDVVYKLNDSVFESRKAARAAKA